MMYNLTKITNNVVVDIGCGVAVFDDKDEPSRRYFLEKRWGNSDKILTVFMTNPSNANALESDDSVSFLMEYAKFNDFGALYVVNVIPIINSSTDRLKDMDEVAIALSVREEKSLNWINYALNNSKQIILAWGGMGQEYIVNLLRDEETKNVFLEKKSLFKVFGFGKNNKFPKHPRPNNPNRYLFQKDSKLLDAENEFENWLLSMDI